MLVSSKRNLDSYRISSISILVITSSKLQATFIPSIVKFKLFQGVTGAWDLH